MENRLEDFRRQRGITQEQLAEAMAVSRQTIGSLENGRYHPSILLAFKLSRYFGVPIEALFLDPFGDRDTQGAEPVEPVKIAGPAASRKPATSTKPQKATEPTKKEEAVAKAAPTPGSATPESAPEKPVTPRIIVSGDGSGPHRGIRLG